MNYEESLKIKTAWYYYIENITQQKIAEKLGISRMKVMKLLEKAVQDGTIQFHISQEKSHHLKIEQELIHKWQLNDAFVAPAGIHSDKPSVNETVAKAAAMYIKARLTEDTYINFGYGDTLSKVLNQLAIIVETPLSVVSLTGGVSCYLPQAFSNIFNIKLYLYPAPLVVSDKMFRASLKKEPSLVEISRMIDFASMTIVGIGGMDDDATLIKNGVFTKSDFLYLSMAGAAGDILSHFIDKNGDPVQSDIEDRLLSTPLETLRSLPNVIGVAAGPDKVKALRAALNGHYLNVLVTDDETALSLLQENENHEKMTEFQSNAT
ncbi:MAG: sugar-binding transcriptional regulator [Fusobacteriaceae bacterium]|jgi:DNA-binding transcriptional regulator LsrR (DeoR family)|nr:sugar-binding transcriptional regulator [Fusobacteriaceae bacterium]